MNKAKVFLNIAAGIGMLTAHIAAGQVVSSLAGVGYGAIDAGYSGDNGPASIAKLSVPFDVVKNAGGDLYFTDKVNNRIRKISRSGIITTLAGTGAFGFAGDNGPASAAVLNGPSAIALDAAGNIYFIDGATRIRKIDLATGNITTIAGNGVTGYGGDNGPATAASFRSPQDLTIGSGGVIYVADAANHRVRKISAAGLITTIAGDGTAAFTGDGGPAAAAQLNFPCSVVLDNAGSLFIADASNKRIRKIDAAGSITTVAGDGSTNYAASGNALSIGLKFISDLSLDAGGNLYFAEQLSPSPGSTLRVLSSGNVSTIMPGGGYGGRGTGGTLAGGKLNSLRGIGTDGDNSLFLADPDDSRIIMICNNPKLPADSATYIRAGIPDNAANPFMAIDRCNVICKFESTPSAPIIITQTAYKVKVHPTEILYNGQHLVKRYYNIQADNAATTGTLTLFFTQAEFNSYNANATGFLKLPTGTGDVTGRSHINVVHYSGTGTFPGNYTGTAATIVPVPANIKYNAADARWEIALDGPVNGGYYITTQVDNATGISGVGLNDKRWNVYPTVAHETICIDVLNKDLAGSSAVLSDATGRTVRLIRLSAIKEQVDIRSLAPGIYTLANVRGGVQRIIKY